MKNARSDLAVGVVTFIGAAGLLAVTTALRQLVGDFWAATICGSAVAIELAFPFFGNHATLLFGGLGLFAFTFVLRLYAGNFLAAVVCASFMAAEYIFDFSGYISR
jgi:hypothetical protein